MVDSMVAISVIDNVNGELAQAASGQEQFLAKVRFGRNLIPEAAKISGHLF